MQFLSDRGCGRSVRRFVRGAGFTGAAMAILCGLEVGCTRQTATSEAAPAGGKRGASTGAVPVVVAPVVKKSMPLSLDGIGAVESMRSIAVKSFVGGTLMKVNFQEGQEVKKGDLMFEIDPRPYENALHSAEADLAKTTAQLETADAEVTRYSALVGGGMVSKEQYQNLQNTVQTLRATLISNQAAIDNAKLQLDYCYIHAPCDGRTGSLGAHEGDLVRASDATNSLVTVTQLSPIYVTFALPQQALPTLQRYQALGRIEVLASPSAPGAIAEKGDLTFLDNSVDPTSGTIKLKATFANVKHGLWPAQFVHVDITLATVADQIVIPTPAVQVGQKGQQVYVIRADKTAELRPIVIERAEGAESIVSKGLKAGETVVVDGQIRLRPNSPVNLRPPVADVPSLPPGAKEHAVAGGGETGSDESGSKPTMAPKSPGGSGSSAAAPAEGGE